MKNTVTIALEDKKVLALKMYLGQKNSSLEEEVSRFAEQLYVKSVPQNVRDFIDMEAKQQGTAKPKNIVVKPTDNA